jgi:hypothetical protein
MLLPPLGLKFGWGEIAQRRARWAPDAFVLVDLFDKMPDLGVGIGKVLIVGEVDFLLLKGADDAFGIAILPSSADFGHANLSLEGFQLGDIGVGGILDALWSLWWICGGPLCTRARWRASSVTLWSRKRLSCQPRIVRVKTSITTAK